MREFFLVFSFLIVSSVLSGQSNAWMSSLEAAKSLALVQDKMVLMTWEDALLQPLAVTFKLDNGERVFSQNLYQDVLLMELLREYFILVKVNEFEYEKLLKPITDKLPASYISKFNDNSMKVMDANGYIINVKDTLDEIVFNLTSFIQKYAINTSFLKTELANYKTLENFVTALRLASKYIELSMYTFEPARAEMIMLSNIYLAKAKYLLQKDTVPNLAFLEKIELLQIQQEVILGHSRKALRQLTRIGTKGSYTINEGLIAFLYYTVYSVLKKEEGAAVWKSKVSLVNLTKAEQIISNNR